MSNSQSMGLSVLSKEDFKNMAKQREKAKRDQTAKQAKIDATFGEPALPPSVSFEAPVKMSDNSDRGKLREALGLYEDFSIIIKQGKYNEVVGVERQPATPLPGKNSSKFFKPNSSSRHLNYPPGTGHATDRQITSRQHKPSDINDNSATNKTDIKYKPIATSVSGDGKNKNVMSGHSSHPGNRNSSRKSDQKPESSSANDQKPVNANPQKPVESGQNVNQSAKKDIVSSIKQHQREPVLQSIKQELSLNVNDQKSSSSKSVAKTNEKKEIKQTNDGRTVLKVKEENRNGTVINDAKVKHKPKLLIAENVEEMLKEFQVPQPLTGIQTPFKEYKFPFPERVQDRQDLNVVSKSDSKDLLRHLSDNSACQKVESDAAVRVVEEIQEKDSSSSSSSSNSNSSSSSSSEDDDSSSSSSDEENEGTFDLDRMINTDDVKEKSIASKSVKCEGTVLKSSNDSREPPKRRSLVAEKVPPLSTETTTKSSQETEQQSMRQSCSSSESSSSSSDSGSDSGSDSESDKDVSGDEAQHRTLHNTPTKLTSPDNMDTSPSPASKQWGLKQFLHKPTQLIPMTTKPLSCEAPVSDKSDQDHFDEDTDMRRGADQIISDENPPSNDQDALYKTYMSADEFSPPAPLEHKHSVLSPIKSPIPAATKSPLPAVISPLQFHRTTGSEKMHITTKVLSEPKSKERNALSSKANPDVNKLPRVRKKPKPIETIDSTDSESNSYIDVVNRSSDSALGSPQKSLPLNIHKSQNYLPVDTCSSLCSSKPLTSSAKRKESKRDKLRKEKDSVKLKAEISPSGVPNRPYCDIKKAAPSVQSRSFTDPIDDMLHYFPGEKPVSPLRNVLNVHDVDEMRKAGLAVSPVKPFPVKGNVSCEKAKPSVLVKLDLNLLGKVMCIDRDSENFLKPKSLQEHYNAKHQKVTSAKNSLPSVTKSKKVLEDTLKDKLSKSTSSKLSANSVSDIDIIDKKYVPEREYRSNSSLTRKEIGTNQMKHEVPDFDSLLIREPVKSEALSDNVNDSDSSSSDSEEEGSKHAVSVHVALSPSTQSSFSQSPSENKKRKLSTTRDDDSKRRKTLSRSPVTQSTRDVVKDVPHVEIGSGVLYNRVAPVESGPTGKRERHNSASSQHSTHSNVSQRSSHSQHSTSQRSAQGHHSQKRPRSQDDGASQAVRLSSTVGKSHDRSKSTAVVNPVVKNETIDTSRQNGFVPEAISHNAMGMNFHRNVFSDKEEEERLLSPDHYLQTAKRYKYQADDMECSLMKYALYLESVLCFIQGGYAMEKSNMHTDASNMYKDTSKLVSHQFHQFRLHDTEMPDKVQKLTVLWLRIQSLVHLKLYMLKKNETVKLKRILEDHNSKSVKSSSQPKAPSAPSPHQPSWNRSTGTPSPMSPTPSPANSVCSVGSVGSDVTPSKLSNGNSQGQIAPPGSVIVNQRIHSITQKYFSNTCYLIHAHEMWDQASITRDSREFFAQLDVECGTLTLHSSLLHLVRYVKQAIRHLNL